MKKCTRGFPYWEGCWAYVSCISGEVLLVLDNCACNITTRHSGLCIGFEIEITKSNFKRAKLSHRIGDMGNMCECCRE